MWLLRWERKKALVLTTLRFIWKKNFTSRKNVSNLAHFAIGAPNIRSTSDLDSLALHAPRTQTSQKNLPAPCKNALVYDQGHVCDCCQRVYFQEPPGFRWWVWECKFCLLASVPGNAPNLPENSRLAERSRTGLGTMFACEQAGLGVHKTCHVPSFFAHEHS